MARPHLSMTWSPALAPLVDAARQRGLVQAVELVPDSYLRRDQVPLMDHLLERLQLPYAFHCTESSLASPDARSRLPEARLEALRAFEPMHISEHLSASAVGSFRYRGNLPPPHTEAFLGLTIENLLAFKQRLPPVPVLLENVACMIEFADSTMCHERFLNEVVAATDSFILLDLHNLYVTEANGGRSADEALEQLDLSRVREIHVAGGHREDGAYVDGHSASIPGRVLQLLDSALGRCEPRLVNLEREQRFNAYDELLAELDTLNEILDRHG